jgi:hypothetical protein
MINVLASMAMPGQGGLASTVTSILFGPLKEGKLETNLEGGDLGKLMKFVSQILGTPEVTVIEDYPQAYQDCKFQNLEEGSLKKLVDNELRSLAAIVIKQINEEKEKQPRDKNGKVVNYLPFDKLCSIMDNCLFLSPQLDSDIYRTDKRSWKGSGIWFGNGEADKSLLADALSMLSNLVGDKRTFDGLEIDIGRLTQVFAGWGAGCDDIFTFFHAEKHLLVKAVDVSIYRIPEPDQPLLEVSRLQVFSAQNCSRTLAYHDQENYIFAEFQSRKYHAKTQALKELSDQSKAKMNEYLAGMGF